MGHARRRQEAVPLIEEKLAKHLHGHLTAERRAQILALLTDHASLLRMEVPAFMEVGPAIG